MVSTTYLHDTTGTPSRRCPLTQFNPIAATALRFALLIPFLSIGS